MKSLFFILAWLLSTVVQAQVYDFPVRPGSAEWNSFTTHQQMLDACQIPSDVLAAMSTPDLIETCLQYPLLIDCFAYDNDTSGIRAVAGQFNGFEELLKRNDSEVCLSSAGQTTARKNSTYATRKNQRVIKAFQSLLRKNTAELAASHASAADVYTPKGTKVPDTQIVPELLTSQEKQQYAAEVLATYPGVTIENEATSTYNCHAYAWYLHGNSSATPVWMGVSTNPTHVYWEDGSYVEVRKPSYSAAIAAYTSSNHSALVTDDPNVFVSKWGQLPVVVHKKDVCPYNSSTLAYYQIPYVNGYIEVSSWGRRELMGAPTFNTTAPPFASIDIYVTDPIGTTTWRLLSDRSTVSSFSSSGNTARLVGSSSISPAIVEASVKTPYTTVTVTMNFFFTGGVAYSTAVYPGTSLTIDRQTESAGERFEARQEQSARYEYEIYNQGTASLVARGSNLVQNRTSVDLTGFPPGIYLLIIKENNRKVYHTRFQVGR